MPVMKRKAAGVCLPARPGEAGRRAHGGARQRSQRGAAACSIRPAATESVLCAINEALPNDMPRRITPVGIENDEASVASLRARRTNRNAN